MNRWSFHEGDEIAPGLRAVRPLGGGFRYEVHLAWADDLRALVVVKIVRSGDAGALSGIHREARLLRRLAHPMLVRSFGGELRGERPYLVLEHVEGPRLSTLLRRYGMSVEQLLPLALNLTAVLHYLAHERVVHLDVKPSNIIMAGEPRLIDLSVARHETELAALRSPVGTDRWMAPEQRDPDRFGEIGPASDVWGLGATLRAALPVDVLPRVVGAVSAALEPRPQDRPTAAELGDLLAPWSTRCPRHGSAASALPHADEPNTRRCTHDHRTTGPARSVRHAGGRRGRDGLRRDRRRRRRRRPHAGDRPAQG